MKAIIKEKGLVTWWPGGKEEQDFMLKCFGNSGVFEIRFMQDTSKTSEPGGGTYFEIKKQHDAPTATPLKINKHDGAI